LVHFTGSLALTVGIGDWGPGAIVEDGESKPTGLLKELRRLIRRNSECRIAG
jgi:hypothetical protein